MSFWYVFFQLQAEKMSGHKHYFLSDGVNQKFTSLIRMRELFYIIHHCLEKDK